MVRAAVLGLVALLPLVARADVGVSLRRVPIHLTLTVDRDYPEFAVFLVEPERNTVQRVSPTGPTDVREMLAAVRRSPENSRDTACPHRLDSFLPESTKRP